MAEKHFLKVHCSDCGRTIAVDNKDVIEIKCPKCGGFTILDKNIHSAKEHIKNEKSK